MFHSLRSPILEHKIQAGNPHILGLIQIFQKHLWRERNVYTETKPSSFFMFPFGGLSSYVTGVNQHRLEPKPCHHSDWLSQLNQSKTGTQFSAQQVVLSCRSLNVAQRLHVVTAAFISSQRRKSNRACVVQLACWSLEFRAALGSCADGVWSFYLCICKTA